MSSNNNLRVPGMNMDGTSDSGSRHGGSKHGSPPGPPSAHGSQAGGSRSGPSHHGGSQAGGPRPGGSQHGGSRRGSPPEPGSPRPSQPGSAHPGGSQHGGSQYGGSQHGGSQHGGSPQRPTGFPKGLGYDPALHSGPPDEDDLDDMHRASLPSRLDLPPEAFIRTLKDSPFPLRPAYNSSAKDIVLKVNQFRIETANCPDIWQYDVAIANLSPNFPKRDVLLRKCWESPIVQSNLKMQYKWFFDGKKLAWSRNNCGSSLKLEVDLDKEYGRNPRPNSPNTFTFVLQKTTTIRLEALKAYIEGKSSWSNHVLECMNFFDHAMRQFPSERLLAIKRNFYDRSVGQLEMLDSVVGASKGIYSSFRMTESIKSNGSGLGVNVDVANTTFWGSGTLDQLIRNYLHCASREWANKTLNEITDVLAPENDRSKTGNLEWVPSKGFQTLRRLMKLRFEVRYRGKMQNQKQYTIKRFAFDPKYGRNGATADTVEFTMKRTGETRTIREHFHKSYNIRLQHPYLPLVETTRDGMFPPEVCMILPWQRYNFKLDSNQTSKMIKFAVTRPQERARHIMENVQKLRWNDDPYLRELGIRINPNMTAVKAKLIPNPEVQYGNGKVNPGMSGRWDLRGRTFILPNQVPLRSWGFIVFGSCIDQPALLNFVRVFKDTYKKHGGKIEGEPQVVGFGRGTDPPVCTQNAYQTFAKKAGSNPTILFVVLPNKDVTPYLRFKKNMECRFGIVSQMMLVDHVKKASPQYCSNVCMKVNCKLGGQVSRIPGGVANKNSSPFFSKPTMMIGMDVSHAGSFQGGTGMPEDPSMAAMTFSMDRDAARYAAACQTNGFRREIMNPTNIRTMFPRILKKWCQIMGTSPAHVFYFRDGVAEGQFAQVLDYELSAIRDVFKEMNCNKPAITVIVATKRHHIRFFPDKGPASDKNGNPLPGTLVEREITHPYYYDFYLCSHVAIQGTARPVHYHVIHDEVKMKPDDLQKMIYHQCYQYQRATTPVSLHPAVYYAHLASARARAHENIASSQRDPKRQQPKGWLHKDAGMGGLRREQTESTPLLDFGSKDADQRNVEHTIYTMWFI